MTELEIYKTEFRKIKTENYLLNLQIENMKQNLKKAAAKIILNRKLGKETQYEIIKLLK